MKNSLKTAVLVSATALSSYSASQTYAYEFEVGETTASIYGYAKLDIIYDVDDELGLTSLRGKAARLDIDKDEGSDGHFSMQAIESRIGFKTSSPVQGSDLITVVEGDFYGDNGNGGFRLRHAYGEWNDILAGQTWTNFGSGLSATPLIDFAGTSGRALTHRQPQLRYTQDNFSFSIEDPDDKGGVVDDAGAKSSLPDMIVRYTDRSEFFNYSLAAVGRYLEYDNAGLTTPASSDSAFGWGTTFETAVNFTPDLTVRAGVTYGDGIGGYTSGNTSPIPGYVDENGSLQTVRTVGASLGASLTVGPGAINAAYSRVENDFEDNPDYVVTNENTTEAWLNYIWAPAGRIQYGVEAGWHQREQVDGNKGDALRLQGMVKYSF
ncbi:DcaP family trimeric outer membrane transporter [Halomonas sp. HMF6819]|uniref:DcaP family trimeric outer membrane transporter n=1 Tax=unclassified Halomonas TaxID=2609666 RepID=UPI002076B2C1|nr:MULTISPECIES: DcaP family trimeric outer membrane transporter [unclassified Halomonas]